MNCLKMLQEIYDREVNISITTFWDSGYTVMLGDNMNGFVAEGDNFDTFEDAVVFLREELDKHFPLVDTTADVS